LTLAQAQQVIATLPADSLDMVVEQGLSAETLTISLISAHMIIFWLSQDSNVTPPVCLAAFAAAAVARANPMRTGFMAWRFAKALYVVPLLFAYTPLIGGTLAEVLQIFIFACLGMYALAGFFENHLEGPLQIWQRALLVPAAGLMLWPGLGLVMQLAGAAILVALFVMSRRAEPVNPHQVVTAEAA
ncbi:MAG: TRAP transporter large permease subunit, partial [Oceanospirillum sp.]|nr:TRAP transporter large permease subunit [Oceanospirillum sp.]